MRTHFFSQFAILFALAFAVAAVTPSFAEAQKKTKAKPKTSVQQEKKEEPTEEAKSEEPAPAPPVQTTPATGTLLSTLKKFVGQKTNLGVLKEVNKDYIIVAEDENSTTLIPMAQIVSLKQIKEEDPPAVRLEIGIAKRD